MLYMIKSNHLMKPFPIPQAAGKIHEMQGDNGQEASAAAGCG